VAEGQLKVGVKPGRYLSWRLGRAELLAGLLVLATLASRAPFVATSPVDGNEVHFVLALDRFDLFHKQPHPPGYLLFLAPAALLHGIGLEPLSSLIWVSIAFSVVGVLATWRLGVELFGPSAGLAAAVLLLTSPLYWSRGELGLSYTAEAGCQALLGWALWRALVGPPRALLLAGALLGLAAGVRQNLLLFIGPLWLWVASGARPGDAARSVALAAGAALLWAVPLLALSGGPGAYLEATWLQASRAQPDVAVLNPSVLPENMHLVAIGLAWLGGAGWLLAPAWLLRRGVGPAGTGTGRRTAFSAAQAAPREIAMALERARTRRTRFFAIWAAPPLLFYLVFFIGKVDYVLSFGPAVAVLFGAILVKLIPHPQVRFVVLVGLAVANALLFLLWPAGGGPEVLGRRDIRAAGQIVAAYSEEIATRFDPREVIVIAPAGSFPGFRIAMLEFPAYAVYHLDLEETGAPEHILARGRTSTYPLSGGGAEVPVGDAVRAIIWLNPDPPDASAGLVVVEARATVGGIPYFVIPFPHAEQSLHFGPYQIERFP